MDQKLYDELNVAAQSEAVAGADATCSKVDFYIKADGRKIFYIDIKKTEKFDSKKVLQVLQNLKEQFRKKKEENRQTTAIMTEEDYLSKEKASN